MRADIAWEELRLVSLRLHACVFLRLHACVFLRLTWPSLSIYTPRWRLAATVLLSFVMFVMTPQVSSGTARIRSNG
jgi:hypothetical protein